MDKPKLFIGLMSGTSLDGIDVALVDFSKHAKLIETLSFPIPTEIKKEIIRLNQSTENDLQRSLVLDRQLGEIFGKAAQEIISASGLKPEQITAIGSHGQTLRHSPETQPAFTLQVGDPNTIAELSNVTVTADFRRRDIAAGGQGAPLASSFHQAFFASSDTERAIINIGGMANISLLQKGNVQGYDTGPGNVFMNYWNIRHNETPFDKDGQWAQTGQVQATLLEEMLKDEYFALAPPKSTGRDHFDKHWLDKLHLEDFKAEDVQATLLELTAITICNEIPPSIEEVYICGGGANNTYLLERVSAISEKPCHTTAALGIDPNWLEAIAFAWLAKQTIEGKASNTPEVSGAKGPRILGAIYQA